LLGVGRVGQGLELPSHSIVVPTKVGTQVCLAKVKLDSGFRRNDRLKDTSRSESSIQKSVAHSERSAGREKAHMKCPNAQDHANELAATPR
jgi:hypothetical protein